VEAALDFYLQEASERVALGFIAALEKGYGHIGRHPESGASRYATELNLPGLRAWLLARYPYIVGPAKQIIHYRSMAWEYNVGWRS
jgi:toxin ParE1/3/4